MLTDDGDELVYTTASGRGAGDVVGMRMAPGQGIAGWVVDSEQPLEVRDLQRDVRLARGHAESTGYVPQALLAVPVATPRRLLGVLSVLDRDVSRPDARPRRSLRPAGRTVAGLCFRLLSVPRVRPVMLHLAVDQSVQKEAGFAPGSDRRGAWHRGEAVCGLAVGAPDDECYERTAWQVGGIEAPQMRLSAAAGELTPCQPVRTRTG